MRPELDATMRGVPIGTSADWAVSAESLSRDTTGLFRLQDFRIGVQRRF